MDPASVGGTPLHARMGLRFWHPTLLHHGLIVVSGTVATLMAIVNRPQGGMGNARWTWLDRLVYATRRTRSQWPNGTDPLRHAEGISTGLVSYACGRAEWTFIAPLWPMRSLRGPKSLFFLVATVLIYDTTDFASNVGLAFSLIPNSIGFDWGKVNRNIYAPAPACNVSHSLNQYLRAWFYQCACTGLYLLWYFFAEA